MNRFVFLLGFIILIMTCGCENIEETSELYPYADSITRSDEYSSNVILSKDSALIEFAKIISKVTYNRKDVREFLKEEAMDEFDMNSDILYIAVQDKLIGNSSFRNILLQYTDEIKLKAIEAAVPLLNMLIPTVAIFDICPSNMDCEDKEIPVAVKRDNGMELFVNGFSEAIIPFGQLPAFHTIVINENSRVVLNNTTRANNTKYVFISPNYDRRLVEMSQTRSVELTYRGVGKKAVQSYGQFYADDGGEHSKAFQRDYIYYGMKSNSTQGTLNRSVSEYISYIEIDPGLYFFPNDQHDGELYDDPQILNSIASREKVDFTPEELVNEMWSKGTFNIRFEIYSSKSSIPTVIHLPLKPADIWDFNYEREYRHSTWFRHSKYTYKIDPNKFTSKPVTLDSKSISFDKWDLSQEGLERYVYIFEEDKSTTITRNIEFEVTNFKSNKISGSTKFGIGTATDNEISSSFEVSTTQKERKQFTYTRQEEDDPLGNLRIYFYDPIIEDRANGKYIVKTYNTGFVKFALSVK